MVRTIGTIAFLIGFGAYLIYKWLAVRARRGWDAAKRLEEGATNINLHYHTHEDNYDLRE